MPLWSQHLLVLALVATCLVIVARQAYRTLKTAKGGFGSCCSKGCAHQPPPTPQRQVFIPSDGLTRNFRKR